MVDTVAESHGDDGDGDGRPRRGHRPERRNIFAEVFLLTWRTVLVIWDTAERFLR